MSARTAVVQAVRLHRREYLDRQGGRRAVSTGTWRHRFPTALSYKKASVQSCEPDGSGLAGLPKLRRITIDTTAPVAPPLTAPRVQQHSRKGGIAHDEFGLWRVPMARSAELLIASRRLRRRRKEHARPTLSWPTHNSNTSRALRAYEQRCGRPTPTWIDGPQWEVRRAYIQQRRVASQTSIDADPTMP